MTEPDLPFAVITLMKGVVYRDTHERAWKQLLQLQPRVRDITIGASKPGAGGWNNRTRRPGLALPPDAPTPPLSARYPR